jgi:hypothetical protein
MMIGVFCKNNRASRIAHSSKIQISTAAQIKKTGNSKRVKEKENRLRNQRRKQRLSVTSTTNATVIKCSEYSSYSAYRDSTS